MTHLVCDVSGHGYGHAAQTALVANALRRAVPSIRLTVRSSLSPRVLAQFFERPYDQAPPPPDVAMVMQGPMAVDVSATLAAYRAQHADWTRLVDAQARTLEGQGTDMVLANVPYSGLAGAKRAGIPAVLLACLNWADVLAAYGRPDEVSEILAEMRESYASVATALLPEPHLPMAWLLQRQPIGPLARTGRDMRTRIVRACRGHADEIYVLASLGGIPGERPVEALPSMPGVHWIVGDDFEARRDDMLRLSEAGVSFIDALRSCDAAITKLAYGTCVEAVCNGTRLLYIARRDWPETGYLDRWVERCGTSLAIDRENLDADSIEQALLALLERPRAAPMPATGAKDGAHYLAAGLAIASASIDPEVGSR